MALITAYDRFAKTLHRLFRKPTPYRKNALAAYCDKTPPWVSNLLNPRSERPVLSLDDLVNMAGYFRLSVDELLGMPRRSEFTGDEQRMMHAFRTLPTTTQDHFLHLLESASIGAQEQRALVQRGLSVRRTDTDLSAQPQGRKVRGTSLMVNADASAAVSPVPAPILDFLTRLSQDAAALVQSAQPGGAFLEPPRDEAEDGTVAD